MFTMIDAFANWTATTRLSAFVNNYPWVWPACETLHFIGLAMLIGTVGLLDLRLLGFFRGLPLAPLTRLLPWTLGAFALNLTTGLVFFAGNPLQYAHNLSFGFKLLFLGIAGANAFVFTVACSRKAAFVGAGDQCSPLARLCAGVSLFSWFAVLYFGRMLPYIGHSF